MMKAIDQKLFPMPDEDMIVYDERIPPFVMLDQNAIKLIHAKFDKDKLPDVVCQDIMLLYFAIIQITSWRGNGCETSIEELVKKSFIERKDFVDRIKWLDDIKLIRGAWQTKLDGSKAILIFTLPTPRREEVGL
jgi:hypothetical protein